MKLGNIVVGPLPGPPLGTCLLMHLPPHIDAACASAVTEVLAQQYLGFRAGEVFRVDLTAHIKLEEEACLSEGLPAGSCVIVNFPALHASADSPAAAVELLGWLSACSLKYAGPRVCMVVPYSAGSEPAAAERAVLSAAAAAGFLLVDVAPADVECALRQLQKAYLESAAEIFDQSVISEAEDILKAAAESAWTAKKPQAEKGTLRSEMARCQEGAPKKSCTRKRFGGSSS